MVREIFFAENPFFYLYISSFGLSNVL